MILPAGLFCFWVSPSFPFPLLQEVGLSAGGNWTLQPARKSPSLHPSIGTAGLRNCSSTRIKNTINADFLLGQTTNLKACFYSFTSTLLCQKH